MQFDKILNQNLNAYHKAFLFLLKDQNVEFLIIGGQARCVLRASQTDDLDVWVNHEAGNLHKFIACFDKWRDCYFNHTQYWQNLTPENFPPNAQISLPDVGVVIIDENEDEFELTERNNIDILFCLAGLSFEESFQQANQSKFGKIISESDWLFSQEYHLKS